MKGEQHKARHVELMDALAELLKDYLRHHPGRQLADTSCAELEQWAAHETHQPTEDDGEHAHIYSVCSNCGTYILTSEHVCQ